MHCSRIILTLCLLSGSFAFNKAGAQLGFELQIKKPAPYDERELKSEKTPDKKISAPKRFSQNMVTHYNYYFNANNDLNDILERAKAAHKDNYSRLLPFYNYSLDNTARESPLLDSIIYKTRTGVVLHDLRNDWVDNLYLIWGSSYYLQKKFDSAYQMFQFINWAFADKEKDGYYRYIGSRMDGNDALSISTKEKKSILAPAPSRNDAFIWQIRTLIQQRSFPEAGSLISTLKNDPVFPKRLYDELEEVQALWYYNQQIWDSAAPHLAKALGAAHKGNERARWAYLAAQLFERGRDYDNARTYYAKSLSSATDPVMEVYARLNLIRLNKDGGDKYIDRNISQLSKMAKRDKYEEYRDVIYSMLAQMELERGNYTAAQDFLRKSSKYKSGNQTSNNEAYLLLGDISFDQHKYPLAASFYDSLQVANLMPSDADRVKKRKPLLALLIAFSNTIERQDSLQRIAAMTEEQRTAFLKKLAKDMRKQQGLKEEAINAGNIIPRSDPFASNQASGEWYFDNENLKRAGAATFVQTWGVRPNVDNWRRQSDVANQLRNKVPELHDSAVTSGVKGKSLSAYDVMLLNVPLTPTAMKASNDSIQHALYGLALIYQNDLEDYPAAITSFEEIRRRFTQPDSAAAIFFNLYFDYKRTNNTVKADEMKRLLLSLYPNSRYAIIITTGRDPQSSRPVTEVTKEYEHIYDLFLAGQYEQAEAEKKIADSLYKTNFWSPQLLYIEAVFQIRRNEDSLAKQTLNTLIRQNNKIQLAAKAQNLLTVLNRRKQIEEELRNLDITRPDDTSRISMQPPSYQLKRNDSNLLKPKVTIKKDSLATKNSATQKKDEGIKKAPPAQVNNSIYSYDPNDAHYAVVVLNKVDEVFVSEARNAFDRYTRELPNGQGLQVQVVPVSGDVNLLLIGPFPAAASSIDYAQKTKPKTSTEIVPWLKGSNYTYSIISEANLQKVKAAKDFSAYDKYISGKVKL